MLAKLLHALAAWPCLASLALAQKTPDVRLDVGDPRGASESSPAVIAASESNVYVAWGEDRHGFGTIYFNRSLNGGRSWLSTDVRLDPNGEINAQNPAIAADGDAVHVAWSDARSSLASDIYFNRSLDAGTTWLPAEVRLDVGQLSSPNKNSFDATVVLGRLAVIVAWIDTGGPTSQDIFLNRSLDQGATWLPDPVQVNLGPAADYTGDLDLVASATAIHAVWEEADGSGASRIFYNRSLDDGLTWMPVSVRLDHAPFGTFAGNPQIAACGSALHVAWYDTRNGGDIFRNRSLDGGTTWLPTDEELPTGTGLGDIGCSGSAVHIVWVAFQSVRYQRSLDQGTSWLPVATLLDPGGGLSPSDPELLVEGATVELVWSADLSGPGGGLLTNRSLDAGTTWLATSRKVNLGGPPGQVILPRIAGSGSATYVTWYDDRDGEYDVYFNLLRGYQAYGAGKPGSGGLVPRLEGGGSASIGQTAAIEIEQGVGGGTAVLVYSQAGPAEVPTGFGTLLVLPPWTIEVVPLGGASGVPGAGTATVLGPIPPDPGLLGQRVNFQAGILDPGAAQGIALTPGLELWIL